MNRPAAMLQLCLLAVPAAGCDTGIARPLEILDTGLQSAAGGGQAGSGAPRGGAGGMAAGRASASIGGRGGASGGRSELQAGNGGPGDRDLACEQPSDPTIDVELAEAINAAIDSKSFCPENRGPGASLGRLTLTYEWRCMARVWARGQATPERGSSIAMPLPPGWTLSNDQQTFYWVRRQLFDVDEAKQFLFSDDRRERREELCAAAQMHESSTNPELSAYKYIGVGHFRDTWVVFISPVAGPFN